VHVFVATGDTTLGADALAAGDAARLTGAGPLTLTAGPAGAEVVIWEMHATLR
jgi:hypothetical protein